MTTEPTGPRPPLSIEAARTAAADSARDANAASAQRAARRDEVQLSAAGREALRASEAAREAPERAELLRRLRASVRSGAYRPSPQEIARALMERGGF